MNISPEIAREIQIVSRENKLDEQKTNFEKERFILQIRNGLGEEIKKNPSGIIIHKKSFKERAVNFLKGFFQKF